MYRLCESVNCAHLCGLFLINGLGMGNSTRCYSVMQRLASTGLKMHVLTSGNGLRFFQDKPEVSSLIPVESYFYAVKRNRLSAWGTAASLGELGRRARQKRVQVEAALERLRPDFCVTDSEYTVAPFRKRGIPVIALNNADVVVSEYLRMRRKPRNLRGQFWLVEYLDFLFHRWFVDLVISPAAKPVPPSHARIRRVGLIVRREIESLAGGARDFPKRARELRRVVVMLSGSILGRVADIGNWDLPYTISVLGIEGRSNGQTTFHGKMINNVPILAQADLLVINGGFSAVSEALALGKPTLVIPIANHAEQYVNACQVEALGLGSIVSDQELFSYLQSAWATNAFIGSAKARPSVDFKGAAQAAETLLQFLQSRGTIRGAISDRQDLCRAPAYL